MGHNTYKAYLTLISNFYKLEVEAIENNINIYNYIHHVVNPLSYAINDIENTDYSRISNVNKLKEFINRFIYDTNKFVIVYSTNKTVYVTYNSFLDCLEDFYENIDELTSLDVLEHIFS